MQPLCHKANVCSRSKIGSYTIPEQTDGIYRKIKQINRALVRDKDNLEVIGFSKDLMEATASAVLQERGHSAESVRNMKAAERCSRAMAELGITSDNGSGKIAEGLTLTRKALNKIVEGASEMRREDTDEGHGMAGVRVVNDSQAKLAISSALLWCHYILDKFHEESSAPFLGPRLLNLGDAHRSCV